MDKQFWLGRWERGETGWHQTEVEPGLVAHFPKLSPIRVLVPLCGKSLDLLWLASQGHEVIGVELSELGVRAFFSENRLVPTESQRNGFKVFQAEAKPGRITIYQGDFFSLTPELLGPIGAVYDRAALIALPPEMRQSYTKHLQSLIAQCGGPGFRQLQIVLERTPADLNGPPFSVGEPEISKLYPEFKCRLLSRETLSMETQPGEDGVRTDECIYEIAEPAN